MLKIYKQNSSPMFYSYSEEAEGFNYYYDEADNLLSNSCDKNGLSEIYTVFKGLESIHKADNEDQKPKVKMKLLSAVN